MSRLERWLEWRCHLHWGPETHCQQYRRWRIFAWALDTYRDVRGWLS